MVEQIDSFLIFMHLGILLTMLFFIEMMFPEWAIHRVSLVIAFAVRTPE